MQIGLDLRLTPGGRSQIEPEAAPPPRLATSPCVDDLMLVELGHGPGAVVGRCRQSTGASSPSSLKKVVGVHVHCLEKEVLG